jgi:hypothetical protein
MTSFWIRKLQENTDEIDRNPISSQLARQVSDLSAAGANLFHAVVELQRLRASSERKFQRWFFETRAELERNQEVQAQLQAALDEERRGRTDAIRDAVDTERANSKTQKLLSEMRKELLISKEEARRAWEELGRREQEERDRTLSLQQGLPTIVGGVQVVPMTQGVSARQSSMTTAPVGRSQGDPSDYTSAQVGYPEYSQASPQQSSSTTAHTGRAHRHGSTTAVESTGHYSGGSEEGEYMTSSHGEYFIDAHGNRVPVNHPDLLPSSQGRSEVGPEDYESTASTSAGGYPSHTTAQWAGTYSSAPDYSGQGFPATTPRHQHPTRLSDVIEEDDERSRTSASQVSRA